MPGQIYLDGNYYPTEGLDEIPSIQTFSSHADSLTGALVVTQIQVVRRHWNYKLILTKEQLANLRVTVAKVGALDLIDSEGHYWLTAAGVDTATKSYSTGCFFAPGYKLTARPQQANGYVCTNRWQVDIELVMKANNLTTVTQELTNSQGEPLFNDVPVP